MPSLEKRPTDAGAKSTPGPKKNSALSAGVILALLALLVWALNPRRARFSPAPLDPPPASCAPSKADFVPTNLTDVSGLPLAETSLALKNHILLRLNMEPCSCGCAQSLAACRAGNPSCPVSPQASDAIMKDQQAARPQKTRPLAVLPAPAGGRP